MISIDLLDQKKLIDLSWERCHNFGFSPTGPMNDSILTGKALQEVMKENEYLIKHTTAVLKKLYPSVRANGLVTVIVDRSGTIIYKMGQLDAGESLDFMNIGSNWSEEIKGTNAIGLVIHEKKPIITHADHHFFVKNHYLTCAASPIYSPTGEFIGAINISARKELFHPFTISLASIISDAVQNRLLLEQANVEHLLTLKELNHITNLVSVPLITLDHEKRIIRANEMAIQYLGKDCYGKEFHAKNGNKIHTISNNNKKMFHSIVSLQQPKKELVENNRLYTLQDIIGSCKKITMVKEIVQKAALTEYPILIYGESGTGKELIAQALHTSSRKSSKPFIAVNCSAIPENLIESELFGYERGAFTGANQNGAIGKFEAANGGTIFLDEIGDMPLKAQAALLRVLQEKAVTRLGSDRLIQIDTRVLAATNKNLREEIQAGRFREDLYYRLRGLSITLPPLRSRTDIVELAEYLITKLNNPFITLSKEAKEKLKSYHWRGNIRELNSVLMQASFYAKGNVIKEEDLDFIEEFERKTVSNKPQEKITQSLNKTEQAAILRTLHSTNWNITKAATLLQISRNTLYLKIKKYRLSKTSYDSGSYLQ